MTIVTADVNPGDLLLFHGKSFISWAIRKIDGSEVNHVAIALGDGQLAEAGGAGLQTRAIPTSFTDDEYLLVRSHLAPDARDPVLAKAQQYLDSKNFYAYQQIVLLAVLGLTRRIPARGLARRMLRSALDHAARALTDGLPFGKSWMICSEYAYRCFDEAVDTMPDPFTIGIQGLTFEGPMLGYDSWIDWAAANPGDATLQPSVTFGGGPGEDPDVAAEADLAPLIAEWARFAEIDESDPLPGPVVTAFEHVEVDVNDPRVRAEEEEAQAAEIPDQEMRGAMAGFAQAIVTARATTPGIPAEFGVVPGAIGAAAVKGAIEGLVSVTVDPNFVTPRDLLFSNSFTAPERAE
jgi:hypothetical protein